MDEQSISAQDRQTLTQHLSLGMAKFIQTHSDSAELLNQSCEYLHAKDLYLRLGAQLKNSQLDKILSTCASVLKEQKVDERKGEKNDSKTTINQLDKALIPQIMDHGIMPQFCQNKLVNISTTHQG